MELITLWVSIAGIVLGAGAMGAVLYGQYQLDKMQDQIDMFAPIQWATAEDYILTDPAGDVEIVDVVPAVVTEPVVA